MSDKISHAYALTLVEEGLKQHALMDRGCRCDSCTDRYGPEGSPGRCRSCYDSQHGEGCDDARRYAAIRDALESDWTYVTGESTREPDLHQGDYEFSSDLLDESDNVRVTFAKDNDEGWVYFAWGNRVEEVVADVDEVDVDEVVAAALDDEVKP